MKLSLAVFLLSAFGAYAADPVPLNIKTGEWESTVTTQVAGMGAQIPPEQLAKLPPEQRARLEAMLKGAPKTTTSKGCVKKEDLTKLELNKNQSCKTTLVSSSPTKQEIHTECDHNGAKINGTVTIEAVNSESIKFSVQGGGKGMSMNATGTSKWIGPSCEDTK